jgi:hypothetical protein
MHLLTGITDASVKLQLRVPTRRFASHDSAELQTQHPIIYDTATTSTTTTAVAASQFQIQQWDPIDIGEHEHASRSQNNYHLFAHDFFFFLFDAIDDSRRRCSQSDLAVDIFRRKTLNLNVGFYLLPAFSTLHCCHQRREETFSAIDTIYICEQAPSRSIVASATVQTALR